MKQDKTPISKGTYTFEFSGIKDDSKEANALSGKQVLEVEKTNNTAGLPLWAIILIIVGSVIVIGIVVLIFVLSAKKKNETNSTDDVLTVPVKKQVESIDYTEPMAMMW